MVVSIIIVTYNSAECVGACLASLQAQEGVETEIIVVDNASADETVSVVRKAGPEIRLIANKDNLGFGRACNLGFASSRGDYIHFVNPDAELVGTAVLQTVCRAFSDHPDWGMAGTCILSGTGTPKGPPNREYPGQSRTSSDFSDLPGEIAWVIGASIVVRRQAYKAIGGFDESFFLYAEDIDFCLRLREHGYEIGFVEDAKVRHVGRASERGQDPYEAATRRTQGIHLFWKKHYSAQDAALLVRRDRRRAVWHMSLNRMRALIQSRESPAWRKYRHYLAIAETSARFLAEK